MIEKEKIQQVVVTDVRMPFWSMVVFMVKWAVASIPAIIILATFASLSYLAVFSIISYIQHAAAEAERTRFYQQEYEAQHSPAIQQSRTPKIGNYVGVPDRCKGNPEQEKCIAEERALASETPEQRALRQRELEAERNANMNQAR